jgi:hypothetical protein
MKARVFSTLAAASLLVLPAMHSSCGSAMGVGPARKGEYSSVLIRSSDEPAVRQAVNAVFTEAGFIPDGTTSRSMSFRKRGNRSAEVAWSTLANPNPVWIRPTVTLFRTNDGFRLTCDAYVTQARTTFGEEVRQPLVAGRTGYQRMLNDVRKRVEKGT